MGLSVIFFGGRGRQGKILDFRERREPGLVHPGAYRDNKDGYFVKTFILGDIRLGFIGFQNFVLFCSLI